MSEVITKIADLIDPEVMADMISAKIPTKIVVAPFAKIDTTLEGAEGDTITVPQYAYIGDAVDVGEGEEVDVTQMTASTTQVKVKKVMKAVALTDEAVLSAHGNPVGEANNQLALSVASKVDVDSMDALMNAQLIYDGTAAKIGYEGIVDAVDVFQEEKNTEKVMFVAPAQVTTLRKDDNFISADTYPGNVVMTGEIGKIANTRIVPSRKVKLNDLIPAQYVRSVSTAANAKEVVADDTANPTSGQIKLSQVTPTAGGYEPKVGDYVLQHSQIAAGTFYACPIVKLNEEEQTEDETAAITVYLKRSVNVEVERKTLKRTTYISVDEIYTAALSNQSKVVLARFKK